jgi:hypothetical protein
MTKKLPLCQPKNDAEFTSMMEIVDNELRNRGLKPPQRPLNAFREISYALGLGLSFSVDERKPEEGVYVGDDMTIRLFQWYRDNYGEKLKMPWGPPSTVMFIREEPWRVDFPYILGKVRFVADTTRPSEASSITIGKNEVPEHNIFDSFCDLPIRLRSSLGDKEVRVLWEQYLQSYHISDSIDKVLSISMMNEVVSDLSASVNHIVEGRPHYGNSKWASLQASEKALKSVLRHADHQIPHKHDLKMLDSLTSEIGLARIDQSQLATVQCSAGVRYGDPKVTLLEAYDSHWASFQICGVVADYLQ